jgi:hypothetical protein
MKAIFKMDCSVYQTIMLRRKKMILHDKYKRALSAQGARFRLTAIQFRTRYRHGAGVARSPGILYNTPAYIKHRRILYRR